MNYKDFERAIDSLELCSKSSLADLKRNYRELSKKYHPDMQEGSEEKFIELNESYKIVKKYMESFRYSLDEEEFTKQFPLFIDHKNWI